MAGVVLFLSHISEEAALAKLLRDRLKDSFLGMIDVFVFSDPGSLELGSKWADEITEQLRTCAVMLILCSEQSVNRRWINFEAGAAWVRNIPLIPICHTGLAKSDLPLPLSLVQGINANDATGLQSLYAKIAKALGSAVPTTDFAELAASVVEFERDYGFHWKIRDHVAELISAIPQIAQVFAPATSKNCAAGDVPQTLLETMRPHLEWLQAQGLLTYYTDGGGKILTGGKGVGFVHTLNIDVNDSYYEVASAIFQQE